MSDLIYKPLIEDMTWSYSRVKAFSDCPYRWFLKYIKNLPDEKQFYSSYGTLIHDILARYYLGLLREDELLEAFLFEYKSVVGGTLPDQKIVRNYVASAKNYLQNFRPLPYETIAVEKKIRFDLDGIPFICFIDHLGKAKDGFVITDHKSKTMKARSKRKKPTDGDKLLDDMLRQLYVYAAAVKQKYGEYPSILCFNSFRTNKLIEEPFSKTAYNEALDWTKRHIEEIKNAEDFLPHPDYFSCRYICGVNKKCCYYN